ncbi:hypothetical protein FGIG_02358 [Fasciola gigantica]|uniref:Uncharacterized protein n=1 Tax=Fasciola gigantica TaxID=46835 RepID=A0A504YV90_FASGI|nr:hypothetical protein FGIG_02358 [Fasciola gigantica]
MQRIEDDNSQVCAKRVQKVPYQKNRYFIENVSGRLYRKPRCKTEPNLSAKRK